MAAGASVDCPLMIRVTAIFGKRLPSLRLELRFQRLCHFFRGSLALLLIAPLPLRQIIVGILQPAHCGQAIDVFHESPIQLHGHIVGPVIGLNLSRDFLPIKDLVSGHLCHACPDSRRNKSTAAEALAPYPSAPISSANIWLMGAAATALLI